MLLIFTIYTILVLNGYLDTADKNVYEFIIKFKSDLLTSFFRYISFLFSPLMITIYCILLLIFLKEKKKSISICTIMLLEVIINSVVKIIIGRSRPTILPLVTEKSYSYPSGHTMSVVILICIISRLIKNEFKHHEYLINIFSILLILLVGLSRIYLGVHYFSDIIGGILLALIVILLFNKKERVVENDNRN